MSQFDVCKNRGRNHHHFSYLMILQSDLLDTGDSYIVAPLDQSHYYQKALQICPTITLDEKDWIIVLPRLAAISHNNIGRCVATGQHLRSNILSSLDRIFTGI